MARKIKILLVEDDKNLSQILVEFLNLKNYHVVHAVNGEEGYEFYNLHKPDICIIDVMMPVMDGFALLKKIRKGDQQTACLILTAKSLLTDKVEGFELGADDYLTKPFSVEELTMRINAILKRSSTGILNYETEEFSVSNFCFNYNSRILRVNALEQKLTPKEADLLFILCKNLGKIVSRTEALNRIWKDDNYFAARSMDVYITKLRGYLKEDKNCEIENIHGTGYRLTVKTF